LCWGRRQHIERREIFDQGRSAPPLRPKRLSFSGTTPPQSYYGGYIGIGPPPDVARQYSQTDIAIGRGAVAG
jgi:hypothetical protein